MNKKLFISVKLICVVLLVLFCRMFFPYPIWIPVWIALAWVVVFRLKLESAESEKPESPKAASPPRKSNDKPHWGKFK